MESIDSLITQLREAEQQVETIRTTLAHQLRDAGFVPLNSGAANGNGTPRRRRPERGLAAQIMTWLEDHPTVTTFDLAPEFTDEDRKARARIGQRLSQLTSAGRLERVDVGLYRLPTTPTVREH